MNTLLTHTIQTFKENLENDLEQLRDQLAYARRTPAKMSAFYGFTHITANRLDHQTMKIAFEYQGHMLLHVTLQNKTASLYRFGLDNTVLSENETLQLFDLVHPSLEEIAFFL